MPQSSTRHILVALLPAVLLLAACGQSKQAGQVAEGEDAKATAAAPDASAAAADATKANPDGKASFKGNTYKVFDLTDKISSWHDAKKHCESLGGHLVVIETEAEQEFIANLADGAYLFLGATDEKEEGTYVWVNGAKFEYKCWMDGQPNNYGGEENYLATYDGGDWVDVAVEGDDFWMPTGYICEWPAKAAK